MKFPCDNGCGRVSDKMTLCVNTAGEFIELCPACARAYRCGYESAERLARLAAAT